MDAFSIPSAAVKVLVVEDESVLAENMNIYLSALGGEVRVASDGASAVGLGCSFAPDVLVLDYSLPDMTGFEVLDGLRRCGCLSPCVLITAHPGHRVSEEVRRRGIAHVLFKPFALADLAAQVLGVTVGRR
ncbi:MULTISPECIES: response regulator transcription factor [unclassified Pseudomonas]|uniref:response regulator transcription factor n=1 Tax=unclassified Pseudomonas TaxID=196821 RepID=UPI002113B473|nr:MULTISPECIES: response regulator [unclassified Pseudomonas]WPP47160.1 response regulator [Pseudomonas sp. AN-1]